MAKPEQEIDMRNKVTYISQKDEEAMAKYGPRACGITSLRMVLSFWGTNTTLFELDELIEKHKAFNENLAWVHSGLINIARNFGLKGYRINYQMLNEEDLPKAEQVFSAEGAKLDEIKLFEDSFKFAKQNGEIADIDRLVNSKIPVIASMERSYASTKDTHMIVIIGEEEDKFVVNDPWTFGPNFEISKEEFMKHWTKRAIVISKAVVKEDSIAA